MVFPWPGSWKEQPPRQGQGYMVTERLHIGAWLGQNVVGCPHRFSGLTRSAAGTRKSEISVHQHREELPFSKVPSSSLYRQSFTLCLTIKEKLILTEQVLKGEFLAEGTKLYWHSRNASNPFLFKKIIYYLLCFFFQLYWGMIEK